MAPTEHFLTSLVSCEGVPRIHGNVLSAKSWKAAAVTMCYRIDRLLATARKEVKLP